MPKTNDAVLVNRLRCVASLLFRKNMGNLESRGKQSTSLRRVVPAASVANHESAGGGSIDEVRQSFLSVSSGFKMEWIASGNHYGAADFNC